GHIGMETRKFNPFIHAVIDHHAWGEQMLSQDWCPSRVVNDPRRIRKESDEFFQPGLARGPTVCFRPDGKDRLVEWSYIQLLLYIGRWRFHEYYLKALS